MEREKFGRLQGLHQSTEISSKAGKTCNSSSGLIHCPDRGSEMVFKSNKGRSSSRVTFLPSLKSCRHRRVFCPRLCSVCPAWLGFVSSSSAGWASLALQLFPSWAAACSVLVTCSPPTTCFFSRMPELNLNSKPSHERSCAFSCSSGENSPQHDPCQTHVAAGDLPGSCQGLSWVPPSWPVQPVKLEADSRPLSHCEMSLSTLKLHFGSPSWTGTHSHSGDN